MRAFAVALIAAASYASSPAQAATITFNFGTGFNDATPVTPVGGNSGTTLGEQRRILFEAAAQAWEDTIQSGVPIVVQATFSPLQCGNDGATLGSAGPTRFHTSFQLMASTVFYPRSLLDALLGADQHPGESDIEAEFNSGIDDGSCPGFSGFYYGLDNNAPNNQPMLFATVLHELGHGLGFTSLVNPANGGYDFAVPSIYDLFIFDVDDNQAWTDMTDAARLASTLDDPNLVWNGMNVTMQFPSFVQQGTTAGLMRLHAPATFEPGSSISHFSSAASPDLLMEPSLSDSLSVGQIDLTPALFQDLGYQINAQPPDTSTLTVTLAGNGGGTVTSSPAGIDCGSDCTEAYTDGTMVTLNAAPDATSTFGGFTGAADCADGAVTMNTDIACTATFSDTPQFTLNISINASTGAAGTVTSNPAGINCGSAGNACSASFDQGTIVTLSVAADSGSVFDGFTGDADCTDGLVTMNAARNCTGTFSPEPVAPTIQFSPAELSFLFSDTLTGTITNLGTETLNITGFALTCSTAICNDRFIDLPATPFSVPGSSAMGGSITVDRGLLPVNAEDIDYAIEVTSNDPDNPVISIPVILFSDVAFMSGFEEGELPPIIPPPPGRQSSVLANTWNGITHTGEAGDPTDPDGYRSVADRGLQLDGGAGNIPNPFTGASGLHYRIENQADTFDLIMIGNRNLSGGGFNAFTRSGVEPDIGPQPDWLANPDRAVFVLHTAPMRLNSSFEFGLLYHMSNGGSPLDVELRFADGSGIIVTVEGEDWVLPPATSTLAPSAGLSVLLRHPMTYDATQQFDAADPAPSLPVNMTEAVISADALLADRGFDVNGRILQSVGFGGSDTNVGIGIVATAIAGADTVSTFGGLRGETVARFPFNEPQAGAILNDVSGANDFGQDLGSTLAGGLQDDARSFDGVDDGIFVTDTDDLKITGSEVTMLARVRVDQLPTAQLNRFAAIYDAPEDDYILYLDRDNRELRFKVTDLDGSAERPGIDEHRIRLNAWIDVVGVYRGSEGTAEIYLNGELIDRHENPALTNVIHDELSAVQQAWIGQENGANFLSGAIDEIDVWQRALTAHEIRYLYLTRDARAHWNFDGVGAFAYDHLGLPDVGTLEGPGRTAGVIDGALTFAGVNDSVEVAETADLRIERNEVSVMAIVRLNELPSEIDEGFSSIMDSPEDDYILYLDRNANELRFKVTDTDGTAARPGIPASSLATGEWLHIVGVYRGGSATAEIYLNGTLADTAPAPGLDGVIHDATEAIQQVTFGAQGDSLYFNGAIDDIVVWDRALSRREITDLAGVARFDPACGAPIKPGQTVTASWTSNCPSVKRSGRFARWYNFTVDRESNITIGLDSPTDPYLILLSGVGIDGATIEVDDDDGPGVRDSLISRIMSPGSYTIEATTFPTGQTGDFTLRLVTDCFMTIGIGDSVSGSWADDGCLSNGRTGSYARYYVVAVTQPTPVAIDLTSSADTFLILRSGVGPDGKRVIFNDDFGGGRNSRVTITLQPGLYTIEATTFTAATTAGFTLTITP